MPEDRDYPPIDHNPADALHDELEQEQPEQKVIAGVPVTLAEGGVSDGKDGKLRALFEAVGKEIFPEGDEKFAGHLVFANGTGIPLADAEMAFQSFVLFGLDHTGTDDPIRIGIDQFITGMQIGIAAERLRWQEHGENQWPLAQQLESAMEEMGDEPMQPMSILDTMDTAGLWLVPVKL